MVKPIQLSLPFSAESSTRRVKHFDFPILAGANSSSASLLATKRRRTRRLFPRPLAA